MLGMLVVHQRHQNEEKEGLLHKRFWTGTVVEEVLILVEERVIVRMMVIRGDTSPRAKILVTVGNTFPRMIAHHRRDCRINPESHRKIKSLKVALALHGTVERMVL